MNDVLIVKMWQEAARCIEIYSKLKGVVQERLNKSKSIYLIFGPPRERDHSQR